MAEESLQKGAAPLEIIRQSLELHRGRFTEVLPRHLTADRLIRVACSACARNPELLLCTPQSLLSAIMTAAQLGLEAGSPLGEAYLVPYRNSKTSKLEAQLIVGYRGFIALARRSGEIATVEARVVRKGDRFVCRYGLSGTLEHEPDWEAEVPGETVGAYCVLTFRDGSQQFEMMPLWALELIRARSRARDTGPWKTDTDEMYKKTVVRRAIKYAPLSIEMARALDLEDRAETGEGFDEELAAVASPPSKLDEIVARRRVKTPAGAGITIKLESGEVVARGESGAESESAPEGSEKS